MKSIIQSALVVVALCVGVAVSMPADGDFSAGLAFGNESFLPDAAPLEAECRVQGRQEFAACMQGPSHFGGSQQVMYCEARAECVESSCLSPHPSCYIKP